MCERFYTSSPANPPRAPRPMPSLPSGRTANGWRAASTASAGTGGRRTPASIRCPIAAGEACNNCGPNGLGCTVQAKASTDVTYWPAAMSFSMAPAAWGERHHADFAMRFSGASLAARLSGRRCSECAASECAASGSRCWASAHAADSGRSGPCPADRWPSRAPPGTRARQGGRGR